MWGHKRVDGFFTAAFLACTVMAGAAVAGAAIGPYGHGRVLAAVRSGTGPDGMQVQVNMNQTDVAATFGTWAVTDLRGKALTGDSRPGIVFAEDDRVSGRAGCNRYFGQVDRPGAGRMAFGAAIGATKMACLAPLDVLERDFFEALAEVDGFTVADDQMTLVDGDGAVVMRLVRTDR